MTNATVRPWLKWAWTYGHLQVQEFASLDDALESAFASLDDEALDCFEGPDGVVSKDVYSDYEGRRVQQERDVRGPSLTAGIQILGPDGKTWAWWGGGFVERADAEAEAERLRERFGDRVKVVGIPLTGPS